MMKILSKYYLFLVLSDFKYSYIQLAGPKCYEDIFDQPSTKRTDMIFPRYKIFYGRPELRLVTSSRKVWFGLPSYHTLNQKKANPAGAIALIKEIFECQKLKGKMKNLIDPIAHFIKSHQKCPYHILMNQFCKIRVIVLPAIC